MNVLDSFSLKNKVALVTGSAGLFGRQIARAVAQAGATTFVASRNLDSLKQQQADFAKENLAVTPLQFDQSDESSIERTKDAILKQAGKIDILVSNSVLRTMKNWSSPSEDFTKSMVVNGTGMFMMTRIFGEQMAKTGGGSIINVGSIHGLIGPDFTLYEGLDWGPPPDYFFHKGGLIQLTKYAASRLGPKNVRVNLVSPGGFFSGQEPEFVERYSARTFLGRMANESDLAGVIVFLASDASAYITAANIPVNAGYTAK